MYQDREEIATVTRLILKHIQGELSIQEQQQLNEWVYRSSSNKNLYDRCLDSTSQQQALDILSRFDSYTAWDRLSQKGHLKPQKQVFTVSIRKYWPYIAAVVVFGIIGLFAYMNYQYTYKRDITSLQVDYKPATSRASITLSDGRSYDLEEGHQEIISQDNNLIYQDGSAVIDANPTLSATITTPRGGVYQITLVDGTRVHMNATSSLTYPLTFAADQRVVELTGEAYFDVAKETDRPFIVKSQGQRIEVLGTQFNVQDYHNEQISTTTLVSGRVRIHASPVESSSSLIPASMILLPGEQGQLQQGNLTKRKVNLDQGIAWTQGRFDFDGKRLQEVMRELSRWYDVDVIYQGTVPDIEFYGGAFRSSKLSTILSILENNDIFYQLHADKKLIIKSVNTKKKEVDSNE